MEVVLPVLWWCESISLPVAVLLYLVHRLEMPEYSASACKPLLQRLSQTGEY